MAIVATAKILTEAKRAQRDTFPCVDRRVRRDGLKGSRKAASVLARLEAPRYDEMPEEWEDVVDGVNPERLVLVFTNDDPVIPGMPAFDSVAPDAHRLDTDPFGLSFVFEQDAQGISRWSPMLDEDECAAAAFRALMADTHEYGPAVEWDVLLWSDEKGTWELRRYIGTESAMRKNFPDWYESERMRAAGVLGVPSFEYAGPTGLTEGLSPAELRASLERLEMAQAPHLTPADYEAPAVPYHIRRHISKP